MRIRAGEPMRGDGPGRVTEQTAERTGGRLTLGFRAEQCPVMPDPAGLSRVPCSGHHRRRLGCWPGCVHSGHAQNSLSHGLWLMAGSCWRLPQHLAR